jgi:hypothetical protein
VRRQGLVVLDHFTEVFFKLRLVDSFQTPDDLDGAFVAVLQGDALEGLHGRFDQAREEGGNLVSALELRQIVGLVWAN